MNFKITWTNCNNHSVSLTMSFADANAALAFATNIDNIPVVRVKGTEKVVITYDHGIDVIELPAKKA